MSYVDLVDDTICALITAPGISGISVLRISGPRAFSLIKKHCSFLPDKPESHRVYFGLFKDPNGEVIDESLVTCFAKGRSFTGDETAEISVHGGFACANRVLLELLKDPECRAAERGEFSFRAFYNGKIDLVQAEAIHSLIKSRSELSRHQAILQLNGKVSKNVQEIEQQLLQILAQLEASIDFSTEDIEPYSLEQIKDLLRSTVEATKQLVVGFSRGKIVQDGLQILLAGAPNAGKSSLYNVLLGKNKAIVSEIAGTTRDVLESNLNDFGTPILLVDTAGLRESDEDIEKEGIRRTLEKLKEANLIFYLLDGTNTAAWNFKEIPKSDAPTYFVVTKIDQIADRENFMSQTRLTIQNSMNIHGSSVVIFASSKTSEGIRDLREIIEKMSSVDIHHDESLITQHRQYEHLRKSLDHQWKAQSLFIDNASYDLLALEIQSALREIYSLLGKEFDEQVLDLVFKQFCIGK